MSTTTLDPVERLLDAVDDGYALIKNRDVLHFTYLPNRILHRDKQQEMVTQSVNSNLPKINTF